MKQAFIRSEDGAIQTALRHAELSARGVRTLSDFKERAALYSKAKKKRA